MLAVLDNAIECFQKYVLAQREREKRLFEAEEWILEKIAIGFSFENICETLQLYPDYIRQGYCAGRKRNSRVIPFRLKMPAAKETPATSHRENWNMI